MTTVRKMLGRLVLVAAVAFGLSYVLDHYHGITTFGCHATGQVAHADSSDCPPNIGAAAADRRWAADRWATLKNAKVTSGLFYDQDGHELAFVSGEDRDANRASQILRAAGAAFPRGATAHPAASHVETKAAAVMRDSGVTAGVIVINNVRGVCGGDTVSPYGCVVVLPTILQRGATLVVWWHGPKGMANALFTGQ
jgi:hypothetical protein